MNSPGTGPEEQLEVSIRCWDTASAGVRLCNRHELYEDSAHYAVELRAPGLTARIDEVVAWLGARDLDAFLTELAADYQGWTGERGWQTNDRDLTVSAVFRSGGYVGLTWTVRPWRREAAGGGWAASVTVWLEAGEQMASLAADVRHFFSRDPGRDA